MIYTTKHLKEILSEEEYENLWLFKEIKDTYLFETIGYQNSINFAEGYLKFNEETACIWGGPFAERYAYFRLTDWNYSSRTFLPAEEYLLKLFQDWHADKIIKMTNSYAHEKYNKEWLNIHFEKWRKENFGPYQTRASYEINQHGCLERQIKFYCAGNDDTSYTLYLQTREETLNLLELLGSLEELDFYKDFEPFGFSFTN